MTTIRDNLYDLRESFFAKTTSLFENIATNFGFPENPGMPLSSLEQFFWNKPDLIDNLPIREVPFPPDEVPQNYIEVLLGTSPAAEPVQKIFYESQTEGFYSFYIENYKNLIFLPNWFSEFLQIQFDLCIDISFLEVCRQTLFVMLVIYYYMISFRILIAWLVTINPYTFPISYFIALVDWIEDASMGILPVIGGISLATPILMAVVGKIADSLNHVVFTMPFLPSEGVSGQAYINGEFKDVLYFRYLPVLWYKYVVPNEVREHWYTDRPDILRYMEEAYKNVDIQLLPDRILDEIQRTMSQNDVELTTNRLLNHSLIYLQGFTNHHDFNFETIESVFSHLSN